MREIKCKYLLPCGYCDKYDTPCKATKESIPDTAEKIDYTYSCSCNHNWQFEYTIINEDGCWEHHYCPKCKETKIEKIIGL